MKKYSIGLSIYIVISALLIPHQAMAGNPISDVLKGVTGVMDTVMYGSSRQTTQNSKPKPKMTAENLEEIEKIRQQAKKNNETLVKMYLSVEEFVGPNNALKIVKHDLEKQDFVCSIADSDKKPENKVLICLDPTKLLVMMIEVDKNNSQIIVKSAERNLDIEETVRQDFVQHKEASEDIVELYSFDLYEKAGFDVSEKARSSEGYLIVSKVAPNSVASSIPLLPGSEIYSLDGKSTQNMSAAEFRVAMNVKRHHKKSSTLTYMAENGNKESTVIELK